MKFEYLKEYKTRGGWKAVYMGEDADGLVFVHYKEDIYTTWHEDDGVYLTGQERPYDIIGEWSEPKTGVVYVYDDGVGNPVLSEDLSQANDLQLLASVRWAEGEFVEE